MPIGNEPMSNADLWAAITAMPRPSRVVEFPRKKLDGTAVGELAIVVLTQEEQMLSAAAAEQFTRKLLKDPKSTDDIKGRGYDDIYQNAAAIEILFRACKTRDDLNRPLFPAPAAIRQHLSIDEIGALMAMYLTVQSDLGPIVASMSPEEVDGYIARLSEGGNAFPLDLLSRDVLKTLVLSLVSRLSVLLMDKSSLGSQQDEVKDPE